MDYAEVYRRAIGWNWACVTAEYGTRLYLRQKRAYWYAARTFWRVQPLRSAYHMSQISYCTREINYATTEIESLAT